jgi:hypothetical protein
VWDIQEKLPVEWPDRGISSGLFTPSPELRQWSGLPKAGVTETLYHIPGTDKYVQHYMLAVRYGPPREEPAEFVGEDGEGFQFTDDYAVRLSSAEAARWFERNGYDRPSELRGVATVEVMEEWSALMSLSEMARRLTGDPNARPRKVRSILESCGLRHVEGHMWQVRLDTMDLQTRQRFKQPL